MPCLKYNVYPFPPLVFSLRKNYPRCWFSFISFLLNQFSYIKNFFLTCRAFWHMMIDPIFEFWYIGVYIGKSNFSTSKRAHKAGDSSQIKPSLLPHHKTATAVARTGSGVGIASPISSANHIVCQRWWLKEGSLLHTIRPTEQPIDWRKNILTGLYKVSDRKRNILVLLSDDLVICAMRIWLRFVCSFSNTVLFSI